MDKILLAETAFRFGTRCHRFGNVTVTPASFSVLTARSNPAHEVMPRGHKVASLLKRWLLGTHQGGVQRQHLDEFTFRFNRRRSNARGLLFHRLAEQAVAVDPAPYRAIIGKPARPGDSAGSGQ